MNPLNITLNRHVLATPANEGKDILPVETILNEKIAHRSR